MDSDEQNLYVLKEIIKNSKYGFHNILKNNKYQYLVKWIDEYNYRKYGNECLIWYESLKLSQRIYCLLNDIDDVIITCECCGCKFINKKLMNGIDIQRTCSKQCRYKKSLEKTKTTNMRKYGVESLFSSQLVQAKIKNTNIEKYGVDNPMKNESIKNKRIKTCLDRYGVEHTLQVKDIREKIKNTNIEKYGVENVLLLDSIKDSIKTKIIERYGVDNVFKCDEIRNKIKNTNIERYGNQNVLSNKDIQKKRKKTNVEKYGYEEAMCSNVVREKRKDTMIELYGVEHALQHHDIMKKARSRYSYNGIHFDSSPELALYIYLKDNNIDFEYQPNISYQYEYQCCIHYYFPDFRICDDIVEIKGDHFFKEGKMICPWDRRKDDFYQAKYQCMLDNGVNIYTNKDYKKYIDYVNSKYGSDYIHRFKKYV